MIPGSHPRLQLFALLFIFAACVPAIPTATSPTAVETFVPSPIPTLIPYTPPDWFKSAVLYEIFVRSFADSDSDGIGDLNGITARLDYLESLGVDAIWLMPIYPSPSVHGYDVRDYFAVNPEYGTLADLQSLVAEAHARRIRVILDFVPSHLSDEHPFFQDAIGNPDSYYSDWFVWTNEAHTLYATFGGNEDMPRFNHYNLEVVDYLTEAALFWLDLDGDGDYRDGVDGFRIDNATFPPQEFFMALRQRVKAVHPDALLLGESWVHNPSDLARYFLDQFDALFDFPLYELMEGNRDFNGDGLLAGTSHPALLTALLEEEAERFPQESIVVGFLSNHDTNRLATEVDGDPERLRLAAAFLASLPGPIMIYYGEEIGMWGSKGGPPHWDSYRREPMEWYRSQEGPDQASWFQVDDLRNQPDDGVSVEEQEEVPGSLLNFYRHVLKIRDEHPPLRGGDFSILGLEVSGAGPWGAVYSAGEEETMVALFNFSSEIQEVTISVFPFSAPALVDLISGALYPGSEAGEPYTLEMLPAAAVLLVAED